MERGLLPLDGVVTHQLPLERDDAMHAFNGNYRLDGRTAMKIAFALHGEVA